MLYSLLLCLIVIVLLLSAGSECPESSSQLTFEAGEDITTDSFEFTMPVVNDIPNPYMFQPLEGAWEVRSNLTNKQTHY